MASNNNVAKYRQLFTGSLIESRSTYLNDVDQLAAIQLSVLFLQKDLPLKDVPQNDVPKNDIPQTDGQKDLPLKDDAQKDALPNQDTLKDLTNREDALSPERLFALQKKIFCRKLKPEDNDSNTGDDGQTSSSSGDEVLGWLLFGDVYKSYISFTKHCNLIDNADVTALTGCDDREKMKDTVQSCAVNVLSSPPSSIPSHTTTPVLPMVATSKYGWPLHPDPKSNLLVTFLPCPPKSQQLPPRYLIRALCAPFFPPVPDSMT